jgi:hypothetical protein
MAEAGMSGHDDEVRRAFSHSVAIHLRQELARGNPQMDVLRAGVFSATGVWEETLDQQRGSRAELVDLLVKTLPSCGQHGPVKPLYVTWDVSPPIHGFRSPCGCLEVKSHKLHEAVVAWHVAVELQAVTRKLIRMPADAIERADPRDPLAPGCLCGEEMAARGHFESCPHAFPRL